MLLEESGCLAQMHTQLWHNVLTILNSSKSGKNFPFLVITNCLQLMLFNWYLIITRVTGSRTFRWEIKNTSKHTYYPWGSDKTMKPSCPWLIKRRTNVSLCASYQGNMHIEGLTVWERLYGVYLTCIYVAYTYLTRLKWNMISISLTSRL